MRVLLFDIDGTLLSANGAGNQALAQALSDEFGIDSPDTELVFAGRTDRSILSEIIARNGLPDTAAVRGSLRRRYSTLFGEQLGRLGGHVLPGVLPLLRRLAALQSAGRAACYPNPAGGPKDHLDPAKPPRTGPPNIKAPRVEKLGSKNPAFEMAIMTGNLPETATRKLEHLELRRYFSWLSCGDLHEHRDDLARETANRATKRYPDRDLQFVVIGDTPADIACGRAIRAETIAVATGQYSQQTLKAASPDYVFDDFSSTEDVVAAILGGIW